nr:retrotransposon protein, putative, unclassified [Tanacetum cinerariifolium]
MASKQSSSGPALHKMTPSTISSGLVSNPTSSTSFVPPLRTDWDILFQSLFDELLTFPPSVDHPAPEVIAPIGEIVAPEANASTGSPSSITIDQDAPSPNALTQSCWIEAMQKDLNEFERLEVWELVPRPDKVMVITLKWIYKVKLDELGGLQISQSPRGIFINQSKYALESLKEYGFESYDPVDIPMVEKSKLNEDKEGKVVDPSHFCGQKDLSMRIMLVVKIHAVAHLGVCNSWEIDLSKHIDIRYHFIKEHVENEVIKLYFINIEYQLANISTKALGRERIEFLINKLGMQSFTPETLKQLADEVEE